MNQTLLFELLGMAITSGIGAFFGWFFTRKKQNIDTIDAAIDTWQKVVDSLEKQVQKQLTNIETLREERDSLSQHVKELLDLRERDSEEIKQLRIKVDELSIQLKKRESSENLIVQLKKEIQIKDEEIASLKLSQKI